MTAGSDIPRDLTVGGLQTTSVTRNSISDMFGEHDDDDNAYTQATPGQDATSPLSLVQGHVMDSNRPRIVSLSQKEGVNTGGN